MSGPQCAHLIPPEHQNFFGLDEELGPVAVSLRREEKEGSGGSSVHSYRVIVRTTQVGSNRGGPGFSPCTHMDSECPNSSAPDPSRHHLRRCAAPRPPAGTVPKETSGACGPEAEPHLPAPGFRFPEGAPHAAHAG